MYHHYTSTVTILFPVLTITVSPVTICHALQPRWIIPAANRLPQELTSFAGIGTVARWGTTVPTKRCFTSSTALRWPKEVPSFTALHWPCTMSQSSLVMSVLMAAPGPPVAPPPTRQGLLRTQRQRALMMLVPKGPARSTGRSMARAPAPLAAVLSQQGRPRTGMATEGHLVRLLRENRAPSRGPVMSGPNALRCSHPAVTSGYLGGQALQPKTGATAAGHYGGYPIGQTLTAAHTLHTCPLPFPGADTHTGHQQPHQPAAMARDHSVTCLQCNAGKWN